MNDHRTQLLTPAFGMATLATACFLWSTANLAEDFPTNPAQFNASGFEGFQAGVTHGLLLPAKTPRARVALLSKLVNEVLNDPAYRKKMTGLGAQVLGGTPRRFRDHLIAERKKREIVIKRENIHL